MNCPTCSYPITADWLTCRRCGAALKIGPESTRVTIPSTMHRRQSSPGGAITTAPPDTRPDVAARPYATAASTPAGIAAALHRRGDTRLPGALPRPDNLLPRAVLGTTTASASDHRLPNGRSGRNRSRNQDRLDQVALVQAFVRENRRRLIVPAVAVLALFAGAVRPLAFGTGSNTEFPQTRAANKAVATDLLRTVVGAGRTLYAPGHTYEQVTPSVLSSFALNAPIVPPASPATPGTVSIRVASATVLILATPADAERCVFARDDAARGRTQFKTVRTTNCRASTAPAGWAT